MKFKKILIILLLPLFFLGTESVVIESSEKTVIAYEISVELSEQFEEVEESEIVYPTFPTLYRFSAKYSVLYLLDNYHINIQKPPIIS